MKVIFLFASLFLLLSCAKQPANQQFEQTLVDSATISHISKVNSVQYLTEISEAKRKEIEERNAKFEVVPDEWKQIDFENYAYPNNWEKKNITLKDGKYEFNSSNHRGFVVFGNVFYLDLTNDKNKEAIVYLTEFNCGGGCDGGSENFYVFTLNKLKPKIIWEYSGGSRGYDGGLKSFVIKNKEITTEKFEGCTESDVRNSADCFGKFWAKTISRQTVFFDDKQAIEKSKEIIETDVMNVMNYSSEISVSE